MTAFITIKCDHCGVSSPWKELIERTSPYEAMQQMEGWMSSPRGDYCPRCVAAEHRATPITPEDILEMRRRPGRGGKNNRHYVTWAARYVETPGPTPIADLAKQAGSRPEHIRDLIHTCRERGLLLDGRLTPYAIQLIEEEH